MNYVPKAEKNSFEAQVNPNSAGVLIISSCAKSIIRCSKLGSFGERRVGFLRQAVRNVLAAL